MRGRQNGGFILTQARTLPVVTPSLQLRTLHVREKKEKRGKDGTNLGYLGEVRVQLLYFSLRYTYTVLVKLGHATFAHVHVRVHKGHRHGNAMTRQHEWKRGCSG